MKKILITVTLLFLMTTQVLAQAIYEEIPDIANEEAHHKIVSIKHLFRDGMSLSWMCIDDKLNLSLVHSLPDINHSTIVLYKFAYSGFSPTNISFLPLHPKGNAISFDDDSSSFTSSLKSHGRMKIKITEQETKHDVLNAIIDDKAIISTFITRGVNLDKELKKLECYKPHLN